MTVKTIDFLNQTMQCSAVQCPMQVVKIFTRVCSWRRKELKWRPWINWISCTEVDQSWALEVFFYRRRHLRKVRRHFTTKLCIEMISHVISPSMIHPYRADVPLRREELQRRGQGGHVPGHSQHGHRGRHHVPLHRPGHGQAERPGRELCCKDLVSWHRNYSRLCPSKFHFPKVPTCVQLHRRLSFLLRMKILPPGQKDKYDKKLINFFKQGLLEKRSPGQNHCIENYEMAFSTRKKDGQIASACPAHLMVYQ